MFFFGWESLNEKVMRSERGNKWKDVSTWEDRSRNNANPLGYAVIKGFTFTTTIQGFP